MASKVEICNLAIQNLGGNYITSLTEGSEAAIECNLRFDTARRALLNMHPWNFATRRAALNVDTSAPAFNYLYQFTLPSDFLYMIMTGQEESSQANSLFNTALNPTITNSFVGINQADKYRIESTSAGLKLLSNSSDVNIIYVADVEDTQLFSGVFTDLLARYLSMLLAYKITGNSKERDTQYTIFQKELTDYQSIDSQQGVFDKIENSSFLTARL
jgi:hypothetical protein